MNWIDMELELRICQFDLHTVCTETWFQDRYDLFVLDIAAESLKSCMYDLKDLQLMHLDTSFFSN